MKINYEKFESIDDFMKCVETRPKNKLMQGANSSRTGTEEFTGTKSYGEALELLKNGYVKPLEKIKSEVARDLKISQNRPRRVPQNAVIGFIPNVPNYLLGIPEQMITVHQIPQKAKTISISYYIGNNAHVTSEDLEEGGIKLLKVINRLELSGVRVNLNAILMCTYKNYEWQIASVNLKSYREQLDIKKLCFPLAHSSMFRRFGFAWLERSKTMINSFSCGYGHSATTKDEERLNELVFRKNDEYFITQHHVSESSVEEIIELLKNK